MKKKDKKIGLNIQEAEDNCENDVYCALIGFACLD